jgi:rod shape determining protein RodA
MNSRESNLSRLDYGTILLYLLMVFLGWINIYAAVYDSEHQSIFDVTQQYGKQLIWIATSLFLGIVILFIDARFFSSFSYVVYGLFVFLLLAVLFFGKEVSGSRSWFEITENFRLQPSEFAKFATALALSKFLSEINIKKGFNKTKLISYSIIFLPVALILFQHDTGSAIVFLAFILVLYREGISGKLLLFGIMAIVLFIMTLLLLKFYVVLAVVLVTAALIFFSNKKRKSILNISLIAAISIAYIFSVDYVYEDILETHQKTRIDVLLGRVDDNKGVGYNVNQSLIAIGSGGFTGKGYLQGTQTKYKFVPEQSTDFIFCTVGEEWGFLGSLLVIVLFVVFLLRLIKMAERQESSYSRIYGYCVAAIVFFHFFVNIGMTIGLAPVIGIPLPFFSYGGSSLWSFTILLFIFIKQDASRTKIL